jgi:hypothetical protein
MKYILLFCYIYCIIVTFQIARQDQLNQLRKKEEMYRNKNKDQ